MAHSSESRHGIHLPTGWRIVGRGAEEIAERAVAAAERLVPGAIADTLYAVQCTMEPVVRGRPSVERVLDAVTDEIRRTWAECPRLLRDTEVERPASRFGGLRYEVLAEPGREWVGEIVWRAVHPVVAGAPITTRVQLEERPSYTRLSVRVTADEGPTSVRGYVGAGQARPAFFEALRRDVTVSWMGGPLSVHPIRSGEVEDFVRSVLAAGSRNVPVAVLSPKEEGGYVVDPADLVWDLLGRARLYVLQDHRQTFDLSDAVGDRRMSSYWGAVRCYLPGWSRHDDPLEHPLLVADRLADPVMRATWLGELGIWMGMQLTLPPTVEERRTAARSAVQERVSQPPGEVPGGTGGKPRAESGTAQAPAQSAGPEPAADAQVGVQGAPPAAGFDRLIAEVRGLGSLLARLTDEVERLRTISAVRSASTTAMERRLGRLEDILEHVIPDGSGPAPGVAGEEVEPARPSDADGQGAGEEGPATLVDVVRASAESQSDALVFLDSAHASAADSPYEDPERVRAILDAMARVARRRRDGVLGTSLREAFADLGIDYRPAIARSTSARLREQYRFVQRSGELVEAEEHIVLGNTYDPRRCLRVYFSSRVPNEPRFVIGHVGRHFEVQSST